MILQIITVVLCVITLVVLFFLTVKKDKKVSDTKFQEELLNIRRDFKTVSDNQSELMGKLNEILLMSIKGYNENVMNYLSMTETAGREQLREILSGNNEKMTRAVDVLEKGLQKLQSDNERKLEEMRRTVDEKLNVSLERRLTDSFNIINNRLEAVYKGLGEMQSLASGVGDLKKVLTNVKTRGVWGEVQLGNLLEQMLARNQYAANVAIKKNSQERCDYAVFLPGKDDKTIYLPIDAKFPIEDYQRLCEISDAGNPQAIELCVKGIEKRVKEEAKKICEKYIDVPNTTDFAVMYLALEGLYAEVLRRPGLVESLQREFRIVVCGPTTLSAILNSFQLGFKSLSIEKRSSEIWQLLGVFRQEFSKFVDLLYKTQKKLAEASNTIEFATKKSKTIAKKLEGVNLGDENKNLIDDLSEEYTDDDEI